MWLELGALVEGHAGFGVDQATLAVTVSLTWLATRGSLSVWQLVALGLVALVDTTVVGVALGVAMEVPLGVVLEAILAVALVVAEEWEVSLVELVALEGLVVLVVLALVGLVALALVVFLGESKK